MSFFIMLGLTWYLVCVGSNCCVYDPLIDISILRIISTHFMEKCTVHTHSRLPTSLKAGQGKNTTFDFTGSSRCFRLNKSVLETKETKHTDSQLHFAPKITKIHLVVFENELIEDAMLVPKKFQNWKPVFYSCMNAWCMLGDYWNSWYVYTRVKHGFSVLELFWN